MKKLTLEKQKQELTKYLELLGKKNNPASNGIKVILTERLKNIDILMKTDTLRHQPNNLTQKEGRYELGYQKDITEILCNIEKELREIRKCLEPAAVDLSVDGKAIAEAIQRETERRGISINR